ncbi:uncharacterized protein (DUF2267 family) [Rhodobium orientis]|uniref:Type IV secretion system coupling protein TraD DNA-binding domain-containing protein n=1 Tax=Rhodobium orientis TaxID=34017 RepID=A0A327JIN4_9HYPH|nr:type IV secretory system conjugative DNA transfer family protein [Rhodobium orientis]MBB4302824.1 uncharacterized protein (DUF2267 family) [Rhodobium orientis]RAI26270.1 hypothetical protein CH339_14895 [Rhodobium orientis]
MIHLAARLHAFINGLFTPSDAVLTRTLHDKVARLLAKHELTHPPGRARLAEEIAEQVLAQVSSDIQPNVQETLSDLIERIFEYEDMFRLPRVDWSERHSVSEYWELRDVLNVQRRLLEDFDRTTALFATALLNCLDPIVRAAPAVAEPRPSTGDIVVPADLIRSIGNVAEITEHICAVLVDDDLAAAHLFERHQRTIEANAIEASGGNPRDPRGFSKPLKLPTKSDIRDPETLVATYLGGTPIHNLLIGSVDFAIPTRSRFEHHHIVAGSGHGKTQTLQYLIAEDLKAVARGERSVIVLDSQGDLINTISRLKLFAPGEPLHERIVVIDPTDVEWPVSLNLFDVGLERLDRYSQLDRERLTNSILELYDFVLGSLLAAEMTQKQSVIFRYVTRLMLYIPDATIHTLRELMEPKSEVTFAAHIAKLHGTARHFFETEFPSKEFEQTRKQVLRRLWGILENRTFERMFSHPRSKLDLYAEMNAGKVILINTAKDLLKESGTEIFGRFFIALIAQAAQERATLPVRQRMPTIVYIDEAADYFDRNIGIILSQARKYNVGMVLAHQYLGQLDPKLQEAFAANTAIKFAGGVSAKDARILAPMMGCEATLIEEQPKGSFVASIRSVTKSAVPLRFPFGRMEAMERMSKEEARELRDAMRSRYAVHYTELEETEEAAEPEECATDDREPTDGDTTSAAEQQPNQPADNPDDIDTRPSPNW